MPLIEHKNAKRHRTHVSWFEPASRVSSFEPAPRISWFEPAPRVSYFEPAPRVSWFEPATRVSRRLLRASVDGCFGRQLTVASAVGLQAHQGGRSLLPVARELQRLGSAFAQVHGLCGAQPTPSIFILAHALALPSILKPCGVGHALIRHAHAHAHAHAPCTCTCTCTMHHAHAHAPCTMHMHMHMHMHHAHPSPSSACTFASDPPGACSRHGQPFTPRSTLSRGESDHTLHPLTHRVHLSPCIQSHAFPGARTRLDPSSVGCR